MPAKRKLTMRQLRQMLRLAGDGTSARDIALTLGVARSTIQDNLKRATTAGLTWPLPGELTDDALEDKLFARAGVKQGMRRRPEPNWADLVVELKKPGVTLLILWEEYRAVHPGGYGYSRFCDLFRGFERRLSPTMRQDHVAGDKVFVDYSGKKIAIVDPCTGEIREAEIFVAVLGASNFTYAEATWTQTLPDWIGAHVRMFRFFEGVPRLIVPDNLKSGVNRACFYDPEINRSYGMMASHYGVGVLPARPRRPKDKAIVSYCTSSGYLRGDRHEPGVSRAASAAALNDGLPLRNLPEAAGQVITIALPDEALSSPIMDGRLRHAKARRDLSCGEHAATAQPLITAIQLVGDPNKGNLLQIEGLVFPGPQPTLVEDFGDLAIAVLLEQTIDFSDEFGPELADLRDRQRPVEDQRARGAAAEAHMGGDRIRLDQRHVVDQQAQDSLALPRIYAWVVPDARELLGEFEDPPAPLGIECCRLAATMSLVVLDGLGMDAKLVVPVCLEGVGDKPVIGVDLHIAPACDVRFVVLAFEMLATQGIGLGGARLDLIVDPHRRHGHYRPGAIDWPRSAPSRCNRGACLA